VGDYVVRSRAKARSCEFATMLDANLLEQSRIGASNKAVEDGFAAIWPQSNRMV